MTGAVLRPALRGWRRRPLPALAIVATLALGIGANSAVFTLVRGVLLRPLDYPASHRLVRVWHTYPSFRDSPNPRFQAMWDRMPLSSLNALELRDASATLTTIGLYQDHPVTLFHGSGGTEPERIPAAATDAALFAALDVEPQRGRTYTDDEVDTGAAIVVLSHGFWQQALAGADDVVGRSFDLDGRLHEVVGVMPAGFRIAGRPADRLWVPLRFSADERERRMNLAYSGIGRLRPGVELATAQAEMDTAAAALAASVPDGNDGIGVRMAPLLDTVVGDSRPLLRLLAAAVALVLIVACVNVAHLLLVQTAARRRELAVRIAIGASRGQLLRQLLVEPLVLSLVGGGVGLVVAGVTLDGLLASLPADLPRATDIRVDGAVLLFTTGVSVMVAVAVGLVSAWRALSASPANDLRAGPATVGAAGGARDRIHGVLAVAEIALTLTLTAGAGLLVHSLARLHAVEPGFTTRNVLVQRIALPAARYGEPERNATFAERLDATLAALPGVQRAGLTTRLPLAGPALVAGFTIPGRDPEQQEDWTRGRSASLEFVTPGYFAALGIPLVWGRRLEAGDRPERGRVTVVNETFARQHWPGQDAVGQTIVMGRERDVYTVVGVVRDIRHDGLDAEPGTLMYQPWRHAARFGTPPLLNLFAVVETDGPASELALAVRRAVRELDPALPLPSATTIASLLGESLHAPRSRTTLLALLAGLALALAVVGTYAVVAFGVQERVGEIGVRMALGARRGQIRALVLRRVLLLACAGIVIGTAGAFAVTRWLRAMLFGVEPGDPLALGTAIAILTLAALAAGWLPARRASRIDPVDALRAE